MVKARLNGLVCCKVETIYIKLLLLEVKSIVVKANAGENLIFYETRHLHITHEGAYTIW